MSDNTEPILVRATIRIAGNPYPLEPGDLVYVNPDDPSVKPLLIGGNGGPYLQPVDDPARPDPV